MNGATDHVHLLINYPPKHSVSTLVNSLKGVSSRLLRLECSDIQRRYWKGVLWSPSYFAASCGGAPISILREYIGLRINDRQIGGPARRLTRK
jgi:putative transposase